MKVNVPLINATWLLALFPTALLSRMNFSLQWRRRILTATFKAAAITSFRLANTPTAVSATRSIGSDLFPISRVSRPLAASTMSLLESTDDASSTEHSDYEKWVRRLYLTNLFHPVKMGLANIQRLDDLVGNPMDDPSRVVVHIAGTNGKGSVALKIANTLRQSGKKVGIFCSPHVSSFRERMQVNGELISEDEVVELLPRVYELCVKHDIPATFFEITTLLAFLFYEKHQVDFVVLETGLGGRLDATNVIARPGLTVITSIGLEHTRILGDTIEKIAKEKGGIIKKGCPVLVGPNCPQQVLQDCAKAVGAASYYVPDLVLGDTLDHHTTDYDEENQRIATAALTLLQRSHPSFLEDLTLDDIQKGILIRPPCRFEEVQMEHVNAILDVAHNPPAMEYLMVKLRKTYPLQSFRFVVGMSSDKDLGQCARTLLSVAGPSSIHLVEAAHPRAAKIPDIVAAEPKFSSCHFCLDDRSITRQVTNGLKLAEENGEILVVCGSVFLMAEARQALGFDEPRDSDYISEVAGAGLRQMQENFGNTTFEDGPSRQN